MGLKKMSRVNLFCIGVPKSGSTWLASMLMSDARIEIPEIKEINYFKLKSKDKRDLHKYYKFNSCYAADFSVSYLSYDINILKKIKEYNSEAKIIVIIRDSRSRAVSHTLHLIQRGKLSRTYSKDDLDSLQVGEFSDYGNLLRNVYKVFTREKVLLLRYEDIKIEERFRVRLQNFLGIEIDLDTSLRVGKTYTVKYRFLERLRDRIFKFFKNRNILWAIKLYKVSKMKEIYERYFTSDVGYTDFEYVATSIDSFYDFEEYDTICAQYEYELSQWR